MKHTKKTKQLAIWFLLTVLAFTLAIAWDRSTRNEVSATSSPAVAEKTKPSVHGTKIQDIQLGERVVGKNPQENDGLDESILTEIPHVGYNLLFKKPDGTHSSIELLRPKNWLETEKIVLREVSKATTSDELLKNAIRQKSSDGKDCNIEVYIDLPEMGTVGWATLISIKENIEIKEGHGNVVTGRFRHVANNVIDLQVEGVEKIGCTDNHPIWSVDREDFIEAGKLVEGERVLLYNGETRRVVQKLPRPGPQYVNNLEVFGEHVYHVTLDGVLVHNMCKASMQEVIKKGTKEWNEAVAAIRDGGRGVNYRVSTASEAKQLLKEARGNMNHYKQYTAIKYVKGYEMHQQFQGVEGRAEYNDLMHLKWKDFSNGKNGTTSGNGHIFFDIPN